MNKPVRYIVIDFLSQEVPLERIMEYNDSGNQDGFTFGLKLFQLTILYGIYYVFSKGVQFITSLLFQVDLHEVPMFWYAIPILFFIEIGRSRLDSASLKNASLFLLRAVIKFLIIFGLDGIISLILS